VLIDLVFIFLFVFFLYLGFAQGVIRVAILLVTFYLSIVLASLYYRQLGRWLAYKFDSTTLVGQYVGFVIIMLIGFAFLAAAGLYTFRELQFPGQLMYLDRALGMFLSLFLTALVLGMFAVILWSLMITRGGERINLPLMRILGGSVRSSFLLSYFSTHILPGAYNFADPILPDSARMIFMGF
jgi:membrane protein required for colicin V production